MGEGTCDSCIQGMAKTEIQGWKLGSSQDLRDVVIAGKVFKFLLAPCDTAGLRTGQESLRSLDYDNMFLKDLPLRTLVRCCLRISSCSLIIGVWFLKSRQIG